MPKKENEEARMSVEFLRLLSYFVDYLSSSTPAYILTFLGLMITVLGTLFYFIDLIDVFLFVALYFGGAIIFLIANRYLGKTKRNLRRYLDEVSRTTLMKYSEYEDLVETLRGRIEIESDMILTKTEKQLSSMERELIALQKERDRLEKKIEELRKKRKAEA